MSDNLEQTPEQKETVAKQTSLYSVMAGQADGLYKQVITICTAFLGGTLVFYDK